MGSFIGWVATTHADAMEEKCVELGFKWVAAKDEGVESNRLRRRTAMWRWMGTYIKLGGVEASHLCRVFLAFADGVETA